MTSASVINSADGHQYVVFVNTRLSPVQSTVSTLQTQFIIIAVVIIAMAIALAYYLSNRIARPILTTNNQARQLALGNYDVHFDNHEYVEIHELNETLNYAARELKKVEGLRNELIANMSHDLRTPLTMIKAYAEMIRDLSGDNPEKRARHLKVIIDETDRLSSLVNDILDLSKLQAGVTEMNMTVFDLSERLSGVISRFDILKENDGIIIKLEAEDNIVINADITKLEQVVYNLINNAVTYTGDDNTVIVRLFRKEDGLIRFEVTDHGDGIAPEYLPYIWDRYYKVSERNKTHKRAKMGSGIGLSIVKNVLEQHGFKYGADSEVGKGSTFWFEAPEYHEQPEPQPEQPRLSLRLKKQTEIKEQSDDTSRK